jgi:hypothetical protein
VGGSCEKRHIAPSIQLAETKSSKAFLHLLAALRNSARPFDVYVTQEGRYALTYSGGLVDAATVQEALEAGHLAETWPGSGLPHWRLPELV